jgi:hypothetical protein
MTQHWRKKFWHSVQLALAVAAIYGISSGSATGARRRFVDCISRGLAFMAFLEQ